ncbi:hypothetical protein TEQUI_0953 [Taylorella equigenitalis MCE9]|uniref:Uncharacterized protein n=1 Tax=Taylorella equigenitalis (strain MCE9) TaxID=937774 RepID=A0A654KHG5_TAYEM|nr:hypothetical protein TEQUI_0953 [Taylorella equigenitalis MCE9]
MLAELVLPSELCANEYLLFTKKFDSTKTIKNKLLILTLTLIKQKPRALVAI